MLVHGLLFFLLFYFSGFTGKSLNKEQADISAIKATLYFPPPAPLVEVQPDTEQLAEDIEVPEPIPETAEPEIAEPEIPQPQTVEHETPAPEVTENVVEQSPVVEESNSGTLSEPPEQSSTGRLERLNQALSSHLNKMHEQQVTQMSEEASRNWHQDYYQRQTSGYKPPSQPQVQSKRDGPNIDYTESMMDTGIEMSADHQSQFKAKEVDCSTTAGEVARSLAGMFGGRVKCNDNSGFQKYIDARLKKTP